jgi:hypothetical protein
MTQLKISRCMMIGMLVIPLLLLQCNDIGTGPQPPDLTPTQLFLVEENKLATAAPPDLSVIQHIFDSAEYTAVLDCDMYGTKCEIGIAFAANPKDNVIAIVEIITSRDGEEKVLAKKYFKVDSRTYKKYTDSFEIEDPECCCGDNLILRISKYSRNHSARLSMRAEKTEQFNSYIKVPKVKLMEE